ncbi:DUF397 domain-containing protein [Streptomyces sp. NPDC020707]|uniref:DUF397 domain-containing protein n=1 Tax=Streptomyces sp. NPDC020707 TaxID=3365084 RepID=UPI0037B02CEF
MRGVWRKSTYSGAPSNDCVEMSPAERQVWIRDSKRPAVIVTFSSSAWTGLLAAVKDNASTSP